MSVPSYIQNFLNKFPKYDFNGSDFIVSCPCYNHGKSRGDSNPSLYISIGEQGKIILKCWSGCNTNEILSSIGLNWTDLYPEDNERYLFNVQKKAKVVYTEDRINELDNVYNRFLDFLTLEEDHNKDLLKRGFDNDTIRQNKFRSIRLTSSINIISSGSFTASEIDNTPGFSELGKNTLYSGLLIPIRNKDKKIISLKIRRYSLGSKYVYLSDNKNSSGSHCHFPLSYNIDSSISTIRITEGELKSEVCNIFDKEIPTISIPGITNWESVIEYINSRESISNIIVAFDYIDVVEKANVRDQCSLLCNKISETKNVVLEYWNSYKEYKGIDDLFSSRKKIVTLLVNGIDNVNEHLSSLKKMGTLETKCVMIHDKVEEKKPDLLEFPIDVFPESCSKYILDACKTTDAPIDFAGLTALIVAGSSIGTSRRVRIKKRWFELPIFYSSIIAPAGSAKSPIINAIQRPIVNKQKIAMLDWKEEYKKIKEDKSKEKISPKEFYTTEATVAAVTDRLINNPRGILISTDEILSWVKSFNSFSSSNDQQFHLTIWNGQPVKVDRKTGDRPVTFITHPYISVLGSIQPKKLPELYEDGRGDDGFLDRFLFSYPIIKETPYWSLEELDDTSIEDLSYSGWNQVVNRLYDIPTNGDESPEYLELDNDAKKYSIEWYNTKIVDELRTPSFPENLRGFWLKLKAYYFRFALVTELIQWASTSYDEPPKYISKDSCIKASKLVEYFKSHAKRVANSSSPSQEIQQIEELIKCLTIKSGRITAKDLVKLSNPTLPRKIVEARNLLITAQQYGIGIYHQELDEDKDVFVRK